jgi:hypothetical protein
MTPKVVNEKHAACKITQAPPNNQIDFFDTAGWQKNLTSAMLMLLTATYTSLKKSLAVIVCSAAYSVQQRFF